MATLYLRVSPIILDEYMDRLVFETLENRIRRKWGVASAV